MDPLKLENEEEHLSRLSGICQACLASGSVTNLKDMMGMYAYIGKIEIYSSMLSYCFAINLGIEERQYGSSYMICERCVDRLREAASFRVQVESAQETIRLWLDGKVELPSKVEPTIEDAPVCDDIPHLSDSNTKFSDGESAENLLPISEITHQTNPTSLSVTESRRGKSKNRPRNTHTWKCNRLHRERYSSKKLPESPKCGHDTKLFKCTSLKEIDIEEFHDAYYANPNKMAQDVFIVNNCRGISVATHKDKSRKKNINIKYYVRKSKIGKVVPVCQKTFLGILNIKKCRVQGVIKRFFDSGGISPKESRGGDRLSEKFSSKRNSVVNFIKKLKGSEPNCCRYKIRKLNIKKLWRIYNDGTIAENKVKEKYFRDIFNKKFKLSFGTPVIDTDKCSNCISSGS